MFSLDSIFYLGTPVPTGARIVDRHFVLLGAANLKFVAAAVVVGAILIIASSVWSVSMPRRRWITLATIRLLILLAVAILLLRPTRHVTFDRTIRPSLPILIDGTQSMSIADTRVDHDDQIRAGIASGSLDPAAGLRQPFTATTRPVSVSRETLVQSAFKNAKLDLLPSLQKRFDLRPYLFDDSLTELPDANWIDHLTDTGQTTPLGDDLAELLARTRGRPVAGIVLVTDGGNNAGSPPRAAAQLAKAQGVKLFIYGVGTVDPKDIVVTGIYAPQVAFVAKDLPPTNGNTPPPAPPTPVDAAIRFKGIGFHGESAKIVLRMGSDEVGSKVVSLKPEEQTADIIFTPKQAGDFKLTASIEPREEEVDKANNSAQTPLRVIDKPIRVLMVDSSPRWEFKYVLAALQRDPRLQMHCLLQDGDPGVTGEGTPYVKSFPANLAELAGNYDLIILGDIDPEALSVVQIKAIHDFVDQQGGALLVVPGHRFGLSALAASPLGAILPVTPGVEKNNPAGTTAIHLQLTPAGARSPTLRLSPDEAESNRLWKDLPPIYWEVPADTSKKPLAEVLVVDPGIDKHPNPVLVVQRAGKGEVMFLGTDNTWRWRQNTNEKLYPVFWGQLIQRLALPHLLGDKDGTEITTDKTQYNLGETVTVYARLYGPGFVPLTDEQVPATATTGDRTLPVNLTLVPGEPGAYRGTLPAPPAGDYQLQVRGFTAPTGFHVTRTSAEFTDSALNEAGLRELAAITGGRFFREEDLHDLPTAIAADVETVRSTVDIDLGAAPIWFALILLLATVEWILRKVFQLK